MLDLTQLIDLLPDSVKGDIINFTDVKKLNGSII